jgi:hypothetical protein
MVEPGALQQGSFQAFLIPVEVGPRFEWRYVILFPYGTFSGNAGKLLLATVTPISTATVTETLSNIPIAADGSGEFQVTFSAPTLFTFVVAVALAREREPAPS